MTRDEAAGALVIRPGAAGEAEAVTAPHRRARSTSYPDGLPPSGFDRTGAWRDSVLRPDGQVLCGVRDGRIVAVASFRTPGGAPEGTVRLYQFHVGPDHRRAGPGTALHAACTERRPAAGKRSAVLGVHVDHRRAQAFSVRRGWVPDPENPPAEGDHHLFPRWTAPGE